MVARDGHLSSVPGRTPPKSKIPFERAMDQLTIKHQSERVKKDSLKSKMPFRSEARALSYINQRLNH
jgi:hypothetical protein